MVMSTIDRLREQLALPSPVRPVEPSYPAPMVPNAVSSPRVFVPPASHGAQGYGEKEPPGIPAPVLNHPNVRKHGEYGRNQNQLSQPSIPAPPDMPAPVLHPHALPRGSCKYGEIARPAVEGLDNYSEMRAGSSVPGSYNDHGLAHDWQGQEQYPYDNYKGSALDMEQQLEMVAMSLRGDQDEAAGVRRGLMMLQPFENDGCGEQDRFPESGDQGYSPRMLSRGPSIMTNAGDPPHSPRMLSRQASADPAYSPDTLFRQGSGDQGYSPQMLSRRASHETGVSPRGMPRASASPTDYLRHIAAMESSVLKPDQISSTWTAAQGITAVCIAQWAARTSGELSLELNDTLDMSFFDASYMSQEWWFAIKADKQQQGASRVWRFPQDLGLLRNQAGYFPSRCVRLVGAPQPPQPSTPAPPSVNVQKPEQRQPVRQVNTTPVSVPVQASPEISFPILNHDPTLDPPMVPFSNVPLWLPTWSRLAVEKVSPRDKTEKVDKADKTPRDNKRDSQDFDSLPLITSASDVSEDTTFSFTPVASSVNLAGNGMTDSDLDSPAVSRPLSARSAQSGTSLGLPPFQQAPFSSDTGSNNGTNFGNQPGSPRLQTSQQEMMSALSSEPHMLAALTGAPATSVPIFSSEQGAPQPGGAPQPEFRSVQIMRNPDAPPNTSAGIGLQFARPRGEMGACHILAVSTEVSCPHRTYAYMHAYIHTYINHFPDISLGINPSSSDSMQQLSDHMHHIY